VPRLERDGEVYLLNLGEAENRFTADSVAAINALLDEIEAAPQPRALVTCASGKTWSLGLDLDWIAGHSDGVMAFINSVHRLLDRLLVMPMPTVAALQGHTFAAGAMLALAHDFRVMRADRGYFCLPEVDINLPFTDGMSALIQSKLAQRVAHESMTTGRRYGGTEAAAEGIVDAAVPEAEVLSTAIERGRSLASKDGPTMGAIKQRMYTRAHRLLLDPTPLEVEVLTS
jgi:enoyl-CoA hydratase/carnithine racemase